MRHADIIRASIKAWVPISVLLCHFLVGAVVVRSACASSPAEEQTKAHTTDEQGEKASGVSNLVVTNNIAVVRFSPSVWDRIPFFGGYTTNETVFLIRSLREVVPSAIVTSRGLGNAVFIRDEWIPAGEEQKEGLFARLRAALRSIRRCPEQSWKGPSFLLLSDLKPGKDVRVRMRFPCDLVSDASDVVEGHILVIAPQHKMLEVPMKIQSPPASPFYTASLWFLGVFIPALITFWVYKLQNKWSEHRAQWATLDKYVSEHRTILADFFSVYYKEIAQKDDTVFAQRLAEDFATRQIIEAIPHKERRKLEEAITRCNRRLIMKTLANLFPNWRKQIRGR